MFRKGVVAVLIVSAVLMVVLSGCGSLFHGESADQECRDQHHETYVGPDADEPR